MPFKVTARMILELGAELISSDSVAIYELIKNAIDAGSKTVEVHVQVVLKHSVYQEALEALEEEDDVSAVREQVLLNLEADAPAQARQALRQQLLGAGNSLPRFERVLRRAYHDLNWILVRDTGHGMTSAELDEIFLTIGTRSRRSTKVDSQGKFLDPGRTVLGDKGVGRLSAMRLGDHMVVSTSRSGEEFQNLLDIDWLKFSHESDELLTRVPIRPERGPEKDDRDDQGTEILVRNLKGDWDAGVFRRMVNEQFKRIVDPFPPARGQARWRDPNDLFDLKFNAKPFEVPEIPAWLLAQAHAVVRAEYVVRGDTPRLNGTIDYRLRGRETSFELIEPELMSLTDPIADRLIRTGPKTLKDLGPFKVEFYWYNRRILKEIADLGKKRGEVVSEVNAWAGGLMVFRDHFRINPYGGQDDDWLELDKKALAARAYKVNRSQIVGKVSLTARNFRLVEQTNREGLAENPYKQALVGMLRHILISEFRRYIEQVDKERRVTDESTVDDLEQRIQEVGTKIDVKLLELKRAAPEHTGALDELTRLTTNLARLIDQAKEMAKEYEDDRSKFVHLAGIGLMVEFLLHEIGRATRRALDVMDNIDPARLDRAGSASLRTLQEQLETFTKRVDNLDPLSTSRRQNKETFDVSELIQQVIDGRAEQLRRHRIVIHFNPPPRSVKVRAVKGMLLQILENLFENSVYWLKVERRRRRGFQGEITIEVDPGAKEVRFHDNGPGIAPERVETVFGPFWTSKQAGQGRGLGLYISREMARYHDWELSLPLDEPNDEGRVSTFVIEMGGK